MLVALKRERNAAVPAIHRLPHEVLANMMLYTRDDKKISDDLKQLQINAGVCKLRHRVVLTSPRLWDRVSSSYNEKTNRLFLQKSGAVPLTIEYHGGMLDFFGNDAFFDIAVSSVSRWRAFICRGYIMRDTTAPIHLLPPSIEVLDVDLRHGVVPPVLGFQGTAPFKHVISTRTRLDWSSPRLTQLSSLEVSFVDLHPNTVMHLVACSPALESLCLRNVHHRFDDSTLQPQGQIFNLPNFTALTLQAVAPTIILPLIRALSTPRIRRLHIESIPPSTLSGSVPPLLDSMTSILNGGAEILLSACDEHPCQDQIIVSTIRNTRLASWSQDSSTAGLHLTFQSSSSKSAMGYLENASRIIGSLTTTTPVSLVVGDRETLPPSRMVRKLYRVVVPPNVFRILPTLSKIRTSWDVDPQPLVNLFADPIADGSLLCPSLVEYDFHQAGSVHKSRFLAQRGGKIREGIWKK